MACCSQHLARSNRWLGREKPPTLPEFPGFFRKNGIFFSIHLLNSVFFYCDPKILIHNKRTKKRNGQTGYDISGRIFKFGLLSKWVSGEIRKPCHPFRACERPLSLKC